jgi:hypothetical protein
MRFRPCPRVVELSSGQPGPAHFRLWTSRSAFTRSPGKSTAWKEVADGEVAVDPKFKKISENYKGFARITADGAGSPISMTN